MVFRFPVLVLYVNEPAVKFLRWHSEHFVGKFMKTVRESVNGEEVCRLPTVD
jgi:hypothetical protein